MASNAGALIGGVAFGVRELAPAFSTADSSAVGASPRRVAASKSGDPPRRTALRKTSLAPASPSGHFPVHCRGGGPSTPTESLPNPLDAALGDNASTVERKQRRIAFTITR